MRQIAIANQKGGSAKTTTTVNLAAALAELGRKVLVIDLDPQGSSTDWLGAYDAEQGAFELLTSQPQVAAVARETAIGGLLVVAANRGLQGLERSLAREMGAELTLRRRLKASADGWDYVLVDTPPTLGLLTLNALSAVSELIVPVEAHVLALAGVVQLQEAVETVRERLNPDLALTGVVACRVDSRTRHASDVVGSLRRKFNGHMYQTEIRENVRLAEAPSFRQSIFEYDPRSSGAADYRALALEVVQQEGTTRH
jgi:chromosome partitioning protein